MSEPFLNFVLCQRCGGNAAESPLHQCPPVEADRTKKRRSTHLSPDDMFVLRSWARPVVEAFGHGVYLVGSAARGEPWRDVDVRVMLPDDEFATLAPTPSRLRILNVAMTSWAKRATGLPVDCQFQDHTKANAEHDGPRHALFWPYDFLDEEGTA